MQTGTPQHENLSFIAIFQSDFAYEQIYIDWNEDDYNMLD